MIFEEKLFLKSHQVSRFISSGYEGILYTFDKKKQIFNYDLIQVTQPVHQSGRGNIFSKTHLPSEKSENHKHLKYVEYQGCPSTPLFQILVLQLVYCLTTIFLSSIGEGKKRSTFRLQNHFYLS